MSCEGGLVRRLKLANTAAAQRIYRLGSVPQGPTLPFVRVRRISTDRPGHSHTGPSGLARPRIEFRCVANDEDAALALVNQVRAALVGWVGESDGTTFKSIVTAGQRDAHEAELGRHIQDIDLFVLHEE